MSEETGRAGGSPGRSDVVPDAPPSTNDLRRNRRNRGRRTGVQQTRFTGVCEDLKEYVYDTGIGRNNAEIFSKTTKAIAEYVAREYSGAGEFRNGLPEMTLPTLTAPPPPADTATMVQIKIWELDFKEYRKRMEERERNMEKTYALILGQCSKTIRDRIEAHEHWNAVNTSSNALGLLRLIRQSLYQRATRRQETHALIEAETALMRFRQSERMSNSDYLEKLRDLVEVYEHLGGEPGTSKARVDTLLIDPELADEDDRIEAKAKAREEYLAVLLLTKSDPKRYGALVTDVENAYTRGQNGYPTTVSGAYDMLVNYRNPSQALRMQNQDTGIAFVQDSQDREDNNEASHQHGRQQREYGHGGRGRHGGRDGGRGRGRGGRGGRTGISYTVEEHEDNDEIAHNKNNLGQPVGPYIPDHRHVETETALAGSTRAIPITWLLLDSCSTTNLISNKNWLHDIHNDGTSISIRCNAGIIRLTHKGYFGSYPEPVWYNPHGIANIMSLDNVAKYFRITMDTEADNAMLLHRDDGLTMKFIPNGKGLYHHNLITEDGGMWTFITTVADKADKYTHRAIQRARAARRFQNIIMRPGARQLMDVAVTHLKGCPLTKVDVQAAEDIYGPNLGALKGKTVDRPNPHVPSGVDHVPTSIMDVHHAVTLAIDIMFINKVAFLVTTSRNLKFGTVEALSNRQITTIIAKVKSVCQIYHHRGFRVTMILGDPEFEPIRVTFPQLNCCAADEHVPDIERYIRTVKDRMRSTYRMLPFKRVPRLVLIHLVKNAVFWLNALPASDGVSSVHSPRYLLTGRELEYPLHVRLEFGEYVQTHEKHGNRMTDRTVGAICLGPNGNSQGGHHFMCLSTGARITRDRWTDLPMPREVIHRVSEMGRQQGMPNTLTFADRHGHELEDRLVEVPDDDTSQEAYDPYYDDESAHTGEDDLSYDTSDDGGDDDDGDEDGQLVPVPIPIGHDNGIEIVPDPPILDNDPAIFAAGIPPDVSNEDDYSHETPSQGLEEVPDDPTSTGVGDEPIDALDIPDIDETNELAGVESHNNAGVGEAAMPLDEIIEDDAISEDEDTHRTTESYRFEQAVADGKSRAIGGDNQRPPRRQAKKVHDPEFDYLNMIMEEMEHPMAFTMLMEHDSEEILSFLTEQMTAKKGLKQFGTAGADAIMKELKQIVHRKVMEGRKSGELTTAQKKAALKYLMFLKQKRCGKIKGRGCADGRKQRLYKSKEETTSPTITTEALFITCLMDALENRYVATCDVPGAFMHSDIDEQVHLKLEGEIAELLVKVDPTYADFVSKEKGKTVIYTELSKALYGTLQAALLFWKNLSAFLIEEQGFEVNPYDWCVVNKVINGKQCTIGWHVDDLKISHVDKAVVEEIITKMNDRYGKESPISVHRGPIQEYLGMTIDYTKKGKVSFSMPQYIEDLLRECPDSIMKGPSSTPAAGHLFQVNENAEKLSAMDAVLYHHLVAKLLYLGKRTRPDLLTAISFLCTRIQSPDVDNFKKLGRCLRYLRDSKHLSLTLEADGMTVIQWWVDASFATHPNCRSHTGATLSFGKGSVYSMSSKQKLNTRSSTEAELVGINDVLSMILWTRLFLEAQGYHVTDNVLHQDNESTIKLAKNGRRSSSKQTRHIEVRYYFITDHIDRDRVRVSYCPTGDMLADYFSKPLQGSLFRKFRNLILNVSPKEELNVGLGQQECVGTNSENGSVTAQYSWAGEIPQGPTFNPAKSGSPDQAKSHSQKAERSYVDVVRGNRSTHSIELIN